MKKRRLSRKKKKQKRTPSPPPVNAMGMEKSMQDLHRLLNEQEFESEEQINEFMSQLMAAGPIPQRQPQTDLERAQELVYEAYEVGGPPAIRLAKKALKISPDCADAYVLLAEIGARDIVETRDLYRKGVEAGERALGEAFFEENVAYFWGILETRPYMRARQGLANLQWMLGYRDEAIAHARDLLRLNPADNQGIRYLLVHWLLRECRGADLEQLFAVYEDDVGVDFTYSRTLYAFQKEGDGKQSREYLKEAMRWNKHVPDFLLQRRVPSFEEADYITVGSEDEAMMYIGMAVFEWQGVPGALEWLARQTR